MSLKFYLHALITLPQLPFMARDGKRIFESVPKLPDASGPAGRTNIGQGPVLRLLCIGESTMAGVGVKTHAEGFAGSLARHLGRRLQREVAWTVYAKSGATAEKLVDKLLPQISEREADLIVIATGANDGFKLSSPMKFRRDARRMIDWLQVRFPGVPVAFTNVPPIQDFPAFTPLIKRTIGRLVQFHGEQLRELAEQPGVYFNSDPITLAGWMKRYDLDGQPSDFFSDGVHPSGLTYRTWAKDFSEFLFGNKIV